MKKFIALMLALVMVLSLTGCLSANVGIVFNENGSGKVTTSMYIADSFLEKMGETPEEAFADQEGTVKKKTINGEPYTGIEETQSFANVQELKDILSKTSEETGETTSVKVETGVSNGKNTVSLTFTYTNPETSADSTDTTVAVDDAELEEMLKAMEVTIEVTFPGGVKRIDGDRSLYTSDGKTVKINAIASSDEEVLTVVGYLGAAGENGHVVDSAFTEVNKYDGRFKDVSKDNQYYESIMTLANAGIVDGVSTGKYAPDDTLTRAQAAVFVARLSSSNFRKA